MAKNKKRTTAKDLVIQGLPVTKLDSKLLRDTLNKLTDVEDIDMLSVLLQRELNYDEIKWGTGYSGSKRMGTVFANILQSMQGVFNRQYFGGNVLLIIFGRFWGCKHHVKDTAYCELTKEKICYIEDLIVCPSYKPNYCENLFIDLRLSKVIGCLYCGHPFSKPKKVTKPYNMFEYLYDNCQKIIMRTLAVKSQALVSLVLEQRRNSLPKPNEIKRIEK